MMRAGTDTGSLINHLASRSTRNQPKAEVGMAATFLLWTDRNPGTICEVQGDGLSAGTIIGVQADLYRRTDSNGFSEAQDYEYTRNPDGHVSYFRLNKKGFWEGIRRNEITGRWNKIGNGGIAIGYREKYHDFSF